MEDSTAAQFNSGIGHVPQVLAIDSNEGRIEEGG
jgi:hypothetical protein